MQLGFNYYKLKQKIQTEVCISSISCFLETHQLRIRRVFLMLNGEQPRKRKRNEKGKNCLKNAQKHEFTLHN